MKVSMVTGLLVGVLAVHGDRLRAQESAPPAADDAAAVSRGSVPPGFAATCLARPEDPFLAQVSAVRVMSRYHAPRGLGAP